MSSRTMSGGLDPQPVEQVVGVVVGRDHVEPGPGQDAASAPPGAARCPRRSPPGRVDGSTGAPAMAASTAAAVRPAGPRADRPSASTRSARPSQAAAGLRLRSATPVVGTSTTSRGPCRSTHTRARVAVGVLADVGQRLADDVVGGDLDRFGGGRSVEVDRQLHGHGGARSERLQRHRRDRARSARRGRSRAPRRAAPPTTPTPRSLACSSRVREARVRRRVLAEQAQLHRQRDQPDLGAVVQVPLQPLPFLPPGLQHPDPGPLELVSRARSSARSRPFSRAMPAAASDRVEELVLVLEGPSRTSAPPSARPSRSSTRTARSLVRGRRRRRRRRPGRPSSPNSGSQ